MTELCYSLQSWRSLRGAYEVTPGAAAMFGVHLAECTVAKRFSFPARRKCFASLNLRPDYAARPTVIGTPHEQSDFAVIVVVSCDEFASKRVQGVFSGACVVLNVKETLTALMAEEQMLIDASSL